ncbi:MAG: hypothetical protein ABSG26_12550 [Bryobacteraceae bacterium]|jgi:hypothetical protein
MQRNRCPVVLHEKVCSRGTPGGILSAAKEHNVKTARKRGSVPSAATAASRKVVVEFPAPLFRETERAAAEIGTSRSRLIRCAVERYLETLRRKRLEQELAAGYVANAALDRRITKEFSALDYENFN